MDSSDEEIAKAGAQFVSQALLFKLKKKRRKTWVKPWLQRREELGMSDCLVNELESEDAKEFQKLLRMSPEKYRELLSKVEEKLTKQDTHMRKAIPAKTKLDIALRFLASGNSIQDLSWAFRVHPSTIGKFLPATLEAIAEALKDHLKTPDTTEEWSAIQDVYNERWNFPCCCGAIDGKHVRIQCPPESGSTFHNYKGYFSIILLAVVDGNYCFSYVDFGTNGKANDSSVYRNSSFHEALEKGTLNLPNEYVFVADDAFGLKNGVLKPYPRGDLDEAKREFNYRLSRARRTVENAFGILAARFRIFQTPIQLSVETTDLVIKASVALHNWLRRTSPTFYTPAGTFDSENIETGEVELGTWRGEVVLPNERRPKFGSNNHSEQSALLRDALKEYFYTHGRVPWQKEFARRNC